MDIIRKHGQGEYKWISGDIYNGEWKNDRMTGTGHFSISVQRRYLFI